MHLPHSARRSLAQLVNGAHEQGLSTSFGTTLPSGCTTASSELLANMSRRVAIACPATVMETFKTVCEVTSLSLASTPLSSLS